MYYDPFKSQSRLNSRRAAEVREKVKQRLGRFGPAVVDLVIDLELTPRKIQNLLERLNLSPHTELDAQLDTLAYFVAQSGAAEFVTRVHAELAAANQETSRMDRPAKDLDSLAGLPPKISTGKYLRSVTVEQTLGKADTQSQPKPQPTAPADKIDEAVAALSVPEVMYPEVDPESVPLRELPWVESAGYTGPERRVGPADRRAHRERRGTLGAVMINRRYGGERRHHPKGRRQSDQNPKS